MPFPMLERIRQHFRNRWSNDGGYREVLTIAFPLILSTGSWSVQHFVDRMFLAWYSPEAIAASKPAGILNFTVMSLFIGTASYVSTFVAQYHGSNQHEKIGPLMWQGIYLSLIAGLVHFALMFAAEPIFVIVGHEPGVRELEVIYFTVLCTGAMPVVAASAMSGFFSGLGKTWPIMWINVIATAVNLALDYVLIFGRWGFPEMGIRGAGIATVISGVVSFAIYSALLLRPSYDRAFRTLRGWRPRIDLARRLVRFGLPSGVQFFLDVAGFTIFIILIGRLGTVNLAASNIAFNINTLAFMPMIGFGITVSILVGQFLGNNRPDKAAYATYSGFHITFMYMAIVAALYVIAPGIFLEPFLDHARPDTTAIREIGTVLLRFIALYCLFDSASIIFASAIKGAGDTRFVMFTILAAAVCVLSVPCYLAIHYFGAGLYTTWTIGTAYVCLLGIVFLLRFRGGKWKAMRVIEETPVLIPPAFPESPLSE